MMVIVQGYNRHEPDDQIKEVYKAERNVELLRYGYYCSKDPGDMTLDQVENWVDKIIRSKWMKKRYPLAHAMGKVYVHSKRGKIANGNARGIHLPKWALRELVVIHELTHVIVDRQYKGVAWHGREFCNCYLALVGRWIGAAIRKQLKFHFKVYGVKWAKSKSREEKYNNGRP